MTRVLILATLAVWAGATLLLAGRPWARRPSLVDRVAPHLPGSAVAGPVVDLRGQGSLRALAGPFAHSFGTRASRALGVDEDLAVRLRRAHDDRDPVAYRLRQLGVSLAAAGLAAAIASALTPAPPVTILLLVGSPSLAFLVIEQQAASASSSWQRRLTLEMPVVAEQLGMLLSAGYSLGSALERVARRGSGATAADLRRVSDRVRQGVSEIDALREWAALARVDSIDRLVGVLALNRDAADLGGLVSEEARAVRRDLHRHLLETIERRAQQVWIPVTVATLVPGVIFLAVPFAHAMTFFAAS